MNALHRIFSPAFGIWIFVIFGYKRATPKAAYWIQELPDSFKADLNESCFIRRTFESLSHRKFLLFVNPMSAHHNDFVPSPSFREFASIYCWPIPPCIKLLSFTKTTLSLSGEGRHRRFSHPSSILAVGQWPYLPRRKSLWRASIDRFYNRFATQGWSHPYLKE